MAAKRKVLLDTDKELFDLQTYLARSYLGLGKDEKVVALLEPMLTIDDQGLLTRDHNWRIRLLRYLGSAYSSRKLKLKAGGEKQQWLEHAATIEEQLDSLELRLELSQVYLGAKNTRKAVQLLEGILVEAREFSEEDKRRLGVEKKLGEAYLGDGRVRQAIDLLEHVVKCQKRISEDGTWFAKMEPTRYLARAYLRDGRLKGLLSWKSLSASSDCIRKDVIRADEVPHSTCVSNTGE